MTDLHGNREAVEAVLAHSIAHGAQRYAFLGDYVGYGPDPAWVVDFVKEMAAAGAIAVKGNHDNAVALQPSQTMTPLARQVAAWTLSQLDDAQLKFLADLPYAIAKRDRLFVHANAYEPPQWDYVTSLEQAARSMQSTACRITFCGHVHEPRLYAFDPETGVAELKPIVGKSIALSRPRHWLVVPGSCGQPRDGNPAACYALFDQHRSTLVYHRVPYDHDRTAAKIIAAGLPMRLAQRLTGSDAAAVGTDGLTD